MSDRKENKFHPVYQAFACDGVQTVLAGWQGTIPGPIVCWARYDAGAQYPGEFLRIRLADGRDDTEATLARVFTIDRKCTVWQIEEIRESDRPSEGGGIIISVSYGKCLDRFTLLPDHTEQEE